MPLMLGADRRIVLDAESLDRDVMNYRVGAELSGWILLLAVVLLALDWWISNRFYAPREGAEPEAGAAEIFAESVQADGDAGAITPPPVPSPRAKEASIPPPLPVGIGSETEHSS